MQQRRNTSNQTLWNNVKWLIASIALAFFVWVIATLDRDPISQEIFRNVPIEVEPGEGLIVTEISREFANVTVRGPTSILEQLDQDDIAVSADLTNLGPGDHNVNLVASVTRRAIPDTSPLRIRVELEEAQEKLVPVTANITTPLPGGFEIESGSPVFAANQVLVSGPISQVEQVVAAEVPLNLAQRQNAFTDELRLTAVDADGNAVEDVRIEPQTISVSVPIRTRSDVRRVNVIPNIQAETLPDGYTLGQIDYDPQVIVISGPPNLLEDAPATLFTEPIDLTGHTEDFELPVNIQLPASGLFVLGEQTVLVTIRVNPLLASRQFDRIPVEIIGLDDGASVSVSPETVTVLITGVQNAVNALSSENIRVVLDVNNLADGSYQLAPDVRLNMDETSLTNMSLLPAELEVMVSGSSEP